MSKTFEKITSALIILLALLLIILLFLTGREVSDALDTYTADEESLLYMLQDARYGDLVENTVQNRSLDVKATDTMLECYAVADYYQAAFNYKVAEAENKAEQKERWREKMEDAVGRMGSLSYAQKISII